MVQVAGMTMSKFYGYRGGYLVRGGDRTSDGAGLAFEFETGTDALYFEDKIQRDEDLEHKAFRGVEGGKPLSQL